MSASLSSLSPATTARTQETRVSEQLALSSTTPSLRGRQITSEESGEITRLMSEIIRTRKQLCFYIENADGTITYHTPKELKILLPAIQQEKRPDAEVFTEENLERLRSEHETVNTQHTSLQQKRVRTLNSDTSNSRSCCLLPVVGFIVAVTGYFFSRCLA